MDSSEILSYTEIMQQRWVAAGQIPLRKRSSDVSEYMQSTYLRLRDLEVRLKTCNYLDQDVNPAFKKFFESFEDETLAKKKLR